MKSFLVIRKYSLTLLWTALSLFVISGCNAMKIYPPEDFFHGTQLTLAQSIYQGDLASVKQQAGVTDLNKPGRQDMTILFYALHCAQGEKKQQLAIMSELVRQGADPLQDVPDMGSVAGVTARLSSPAYMEALLDGGMSPNVEIMKRPVFFKAASDNTLKTMDLMVRRGANINRSDSLGRTVLMHALDGMQLDTVVWLLKHGADPHAVETNSGWSFARQLAYVVKRNNGQEGPTLDKLNEIIALIKQAGVSWPPAQ
ncbi:MAG: ankyrin repeat domain-containing protein [Mixta calida]|uniref:ankyrin repeat domain-containing protein n=1 Tax=Mixta calida TaxID=665913 RepID=UPI0028B248CA|nr:ankyrin repeat domain-containing protein [Mixta calida]MDU3075635.1 ankyrin repeat domain-containing protein [Mixta calida]MDU3816636.1 ankyrin repeat domain-containing protein [Pantoea sp.]MDU4941897.1 ankyrin repeat domain-containing protein [Mixta calida]